MKANRTRTLFLLLFVAVWYAGCAAKYTYRVPLKSDDGWETDSLDAVGLDEGPLRVLVRNIRAKRFENIHSILIVKNGKLVFEEYFPGYEFSPAGDQFRGDYIQFGPDTIHNIASVTKAFTGALVGIAIDRGFIPDESAQVFSFFPEYARHSNWEKDKITLKHLLTMSSGLEWNEMDVAISTRDAKHDLIQMHRAQDPIEYILAKPLVVPPGTRWYYSGGDVNLLGEVIRKATGKRMDIFANEHLFGPLGVTQYEWQFIKPDVVYASGDLKLCPRDMAKFGQLYLDGGKWNGREVISPAWIEKSITPQITVTRANWAEEHGSHYGYHWWCRKDFVKGRAFESFTRDGWGGQIIRGFPSEHLLVVMTGGNYATPDRLNEIIHGYILPALR